MNQPNSSTAKHAHISSLKEYVEKINAGEKAQEKGLPEEAMLHYERAVELRPTMFEAYFRLGNAAIQAGNLIKALDSFQKAAELQPENIQLLLRFSEICYKIGHYDAAIAVLCDILMLNETYLPALLALPEMLIKTGRSQDAYNMLQAALEKQPDIPELWVSAGIVAQSSGDNSNAITFYEEALRLNPEVALASENLKLAKTH